MQCGPRVPFTHPQLYNEAGLRSVTEKTPTISLGIVTAPSSYRYHSACYPCCGPRLPPCFLRLYRLPVFSFCNSLSPFLLLFYAYPTFHSYFYKIYHRRCLDIGTSPWDNDFQIEPYPVPFRFTIPPSSMSHRATLVGLSLFTLV